LSKITSEVSMIENNILRNMNAHFLTGQLFPKLLIG